jgi:hypothetical protein
MVDEVRIWLDKSRPNLIDIASDGSHDQDRGTITYGWVMAVNEVIIAEGKGPAEGHPNLVGSFRAEAYGLASATAFAKMLVQHLRVDPDQGKWFCHIDNKSLIKRMEGYHSEHRNSKWSELPDADVTYTAHSNMQGILVQYEHVRSHQDTSKPNTGFPAKLHEMADALAKQEQRQIKQPRVVVTIPFKHLRINDMVVTTEAQRSMIEAASKIPLQQYYNKKYNCTML